MADQEQNNQKPQNEGLRLISLAEAVRPEYVSDQMKFNKERREALIFTRPAQGDQATK